MDFVVVSADTQDKTMEDNAEFGWDFGLCCGMTEA
jgi:hypothetical protein